MKKPTKVLSHYEAVVLVSTAKSLLEEINYINKPSLVAEAQRITCDVKVRLEAYDNIVKHRRYPEGGYHKDPLDVEMSILDLHRRRVHQMLNEQDPDMFPFTHVSPRIEEPTHLYTEIVLGALAIITFAVWFL